ncbi:MAG: M23 family metallopeptidase [Spirochaetia bacterium]
MFTERFLRTAPITLLMLILGIFILPLKIPADTLYSEIEDLNRDDPLYKQAVSDVDEYYRKTAVDETIPPLTIFSYRPEEEDTLFTIAARCNLPYETIALLNSFSSPEEALEASELLIPNIPGIFVPLEPINDLEKLVSAWRLQQKERGIQIVVRTPEEGPREFIFIPGERFHSTERAFFLQILFSFPLPEGVVTSLYGTRESPLTQKIHFHHGIDIAAPRGTEVYASLQGTVEETGHNSILGHYLVLSHSNDFRTIYGHLEKILVKRGTDVGTGTIIGVVGSTGLSTGPHLHFEIRRAGESWDPSEMIPVRDQ